MKTLILIGLLLMGCASDDGSQPSPVVPEEPKEFKVDGKHIHIEGVIKEGSKVKASNAETAVKFGVKMLEE